MLVFLCLLVEILLGRLFFKVIYQSHACCEEVKLSFLLHTHTHTRARARVCVCTETCQIGFCSLHQVNEVDPSEGTAVLGVLLRG